MRFSVWKCEAFIEHPVPQPFRKEKSIPSARAAKTLCHTGASSSSWSMDLDFRYLEHSNQGVKDPAEALPSNPFMQQTFFMF